MRTLKLKLVREKHIKHHHRIRSRCGIMQLTFHENCLELDPDIRKPAASLLSHPFIKQHKKSSSSSLSLASLVSSCCSVKAPVNDNSALDDEEADTLTMAFNTSKMIDSGLVWDF